ncbi:hypothetical protein IMCC3317_04890 [Kordia antarctica]|uniref:Uncharacterized protein n=1 Tax=Kordia antarctica TaxID=1218801 RepID=A0A7L4ZEM8_9FLAO|nr:hypothetical protein IMCC3317_04890 [Kordia antarctica]
MLMKPFAVHEYLFVKIKCARALFYETTIGVKWNVCGMNLTIYSWFLLSVSLLKALYCNFWKFL